MFDDAFGMIMSCRNAFGDSVRDAFGVSIDADVLDPICGQISSLRAFHEEYLRQVSDIKQILSEARSLVPRGGKD